MATRSIASGDAPTARAAGSLTFATIGLAVAGAITGPLMARALGASGRGELAQVLVPLGLSPFFVSLGLNAYTTRMVARDVPVREVLSATLPPLLCLSLVVSVLSGSISAALTSSPEPEYWLRLGLLLLPIAMVVNQATEVLWGQQRWRLMTAVRLVSPVGLVIGITGLFLAETLTVSTASALTIGLGLVPLPLLVYKLPGGWRLRPRAREVREAIRFGLKGWGAAFGGLATTRVDQLLVVPFLSSDELGRYVVAVTVAGMAAALGEPLTQVAVPRIAAGQTSAIAPMLRAKAVVVGGLQLAAAATAPLLLPWLFGDDFRGAVLVTWILMASWFAFSLSSGLSSGMTAAGYPSAGSISTVVGVVVLVIGLLLLVGSYKATGAAVAALGSNLAVGATLLLLARRRLGMTFLEVVPRIADLRRVLVAARSVLPTRVYYNS